MLLAAILLVLWCSFGLLAGASKSFYLQVRYPATIKPEEHHRWLIKGACSGLAAFVCELEERRYNLQPRGFAFRFMPLEKRMALHKKYYPEIYKMCYPGEER